VHEYVGTTVARRDEAITLGLVEPLNSTCSHYTHLFKFQTRFNLCSL
jgi:hypothetical protein